jgi:hypothetical protein
MIRMATRERTYRCVGGPCDGRLYTLGEEMRIRLSPPQDGALLHKQVMAKLAASGGKVPDDLKS